jgi:glycosyltransferase involved in cell wall biosynthesis
MVSYGVVIPAFNAAATIGETLKSVAAQTVRADAIVVVDDGSTDDTAAQVAACGIAVTYVRQENAGPGSATTRGFAQLATPVIATLDADDLWLPEKIARQLRRLDETPASAGVFTHWAAFAHDDPARRASNAKPGWSRSTMLIRREVAETIGPIHDPVGGRGEMVDWIARAREAGFRLDMLDDVLALRRIHAGSLSYGRDDRDRGYLQVARQAMLRRQAQKNAG